MDEKYAVYRRAWQQRWRQAEEKDQWRAKKLRETADACARLLVDTFGARRVYLFGSLARGQRLHHASDIDLAVEGLPPGRAYWRALSRLWALLPPGTELDLVPLEDAHPELVSLIHQEGELLHAAEEICQPNTTTAFVILRSEATKNLVGLWQVIPSTNVILRSLRSLRMTLQSSAVVVLRADIKQELENLGHLVGEAQQLLAAVQEQPSFLEIRAAGSILHDFYTAAERIFQRIAAEVDGGLPGDPDWHTQLLLRMATPIEEIRPAVISQPLNALLDEYLRFRHLFRHVYGFELKRTRCVELLSELPSVQEQLGHELEIFGEFLKSLA